MKCPICGSEGCEQSYYDYITNGDVTIFLCDFSLDHHFLIKKLPKAEVEDYKVDEGKER